MTALWHDNQTARKWLTNELNAADVAEAHRISSDHVLVRLAACCTAAYEGYPDISAFRKRICAILSSDKERHSAAMFLVYNRAKNVKEAQNLLEKQHLRNQFYEKVNTHKERTMPEQTQKPLTEKQVEFARTNKQRVLSEVDEFKEYLQKQDNPEWWLKRRFFSFAANSFNKHKRDSFQQEHRQQESLAPQISFEQEKAQSFTQKI